MSAWCFFLIKINKEANEHIAQVLRTSKPQGSSMLLNCTWPIIDMAAHYKI